MIIPYIAKYLNITGGKKWETIKTKEPKATVQKTNTTDKTIFINY